jgi:PAS domain S-box-containing protein
VQNSGKTLTGSKGARKFSHQDNILNEKYRSEQTLLKDINQHQRLQEEIVWRERKYRRIFEGSRDMIFTSNAAGQLLDVNKAGVEMLGYGSREELLGIGSTNGLFRNPDDRDRFFELINRQGFVMDYEAELKKRDNSPLHVLISSWQYENPKNGDTEIEGIIKDLTHRKFLEDDLKLSESKYRRIFEGSKDMIFITAKNGAIKEVNQACVDLLGYGSKQEVLSLNSVEKVYDNPMHWKVFQTQIHRHGFVQDFEARFKKKDGTRIHCLLSGNAVRGENAEIIGYEGIAKDITARMDAIRNFRQRHRELWVLNSIAFAMNKTQDLDAILLTALKKVLEVLNLTSGSILLIDHEQSAFSLRAQQGLSESPVDRSNQIKLHDEALMQSLLKKNLTLTPEPIFPPFKATWKGAGDTDTVELTCFLITAKEKASGFFAFEVPPDRDLTTGQDFHLLGSLGNFLGGAIENARLNKTLHKHREELKVLTAKLFHSQELERRRIARELHDEVGQALTGIKFTLETIEKGLSPELDSIKEYIADIKKQINLTYEEMRRISYSLHPALLSDLGLEPALESYLTNISKYSQMEIDFKMVGFEERLDPDIETVLYRISQEVSTNTLKHANARHFKISIIKSYPHIIFLAEDDGLGFDTSEFDEHRQALGLLSMRERAAMLGGKFFLRTTKGKGTRIRIEIPMKEGSDD